MSVHRDVNCIYNNDLIDAIKEFKEEIVEISSERDKDGIYTFVFCRYEDYKVISEKIYILVRDRTIMFFWCPLTLILRLDEKLNVNSGDITELNTVNTDGDLQIINSILNEFTDLKNIDYVMRVHNAKAEMFEAFTIKDDGPNMKARYLLDNRLVNIDELSMEDDDLIHISMEFLNYQIEKFKTEVEDAVRLDQASPNLEDNPFANEFYDRHEGVGIREEKRPLGDPDV